MPMRLSLRLMAPKAYSEQKDSPKDGQSHASARSRACVLSVRGIYPVWTKSCHAAELSDCENSGAIWQGYP